jgi:acyl-CoA synthetase (AMP-forming)/AMP-acid ligase II
MAAMNRGRFDGTTLLWPEDPLLAPGGPFELIEEKVLGAPVAVFRERPRSFAEVLAASDRFGEREAFVFDDRRIGFAEFRRRVASVASAIRDDWQIGPGDRVALLGGNSAEWILAFSALVASGGVVAALNGWWTAPEIEYALGLTRPLLLLSDRRRAARLEGRTLPVPLVILEDVLPEWETRESEVSLPDLAIDEDDPAVILFTSGTTGRPKGAVNTHRNLTILATSTAHAGARAAAARDASPQPAFEPCSLCCLPLFHVSGLQGGLLHTLMLGNRSVWPGGRFDPQKVLELTETHRITTWSFVPTQLWRVLEHPGFADYDLSSVSFAGGGGAAWAPELTRLLRERLPNAAANMSFGFGQTECAGMGTVNAAPFALEDPSSVGVPRPGVEVQVRDAEGHPLPEGVEGEILLRGACVMAEYWDDPAANAATLVEGRWLRTGDIGCIRGGRLYLTSRRSDLILRGGENVYPIEIEHRLVEHPEIADAAVFGVDHRVLGQEVKAVVELRAGSHLTSEAVRAFVAETLAPYKVPAHVDFHEGALPRNASGKVMKHVLRGDAENDFIEE